MPSLSRRGFLALGGTSAAAVALGSCGTEDEPRSDGDDVELIGAAITAESAYALAARAFADQQGVSAEIDKASSARLDELRSAAAGAGDHAEESSIDGAGEVEEAAMAAIAAYRQGARLLSTVELRRIAMRFLAQVAAELAALRELAGQEPAPYAFVTGLDGPPLENFDDAPTGDVAPAPATADDETTTTTEAE